MSFCVLDTALSLFLLVLILDRKIQKELFIFAADTDKKKYETVCGHKHFA